MNGVISLSSWGNIYGGYQNPTNVDAVSITPRRGDEAVSHGDMSSVDTVQSNPTITWLGLVVALVVVRVFQEYTKK